MRAEPAMRRSILAVLVAFSTLALATPDAVAGEEKGPRKVQVQKGDTLGGIAKRHQVSVDDLRRWNPEVESCAARLP